MYAMIFFLNLVLIDAQTEKIHSNVGRVDPTSGQVAQSPGSVMGFIVPKAVICVGIFVTVLLFQNNHSLRLATYVTEMSQLDDQVVTKPLFGDVDLADIISFGVFALYTIISLRLC
jgi:hypothetical protein